jgi:hypothetical protein
MKRIQTTFDNKISDLKEPVAGSEEYQDSRSLWYIVLLSLAPIYLLIIIGVITFALIMLDRHFILLTNYVLQQVIFIAILSIGISVAIIVYSLSIMFAQRKIGMWRQNGQRKQAIIGQLLLVIVATLMILPIILALFIH